MTISPPRLTNQAHQLRMFPLQVPPRTLRPDRLPVPGLAGQEARKARPPACSLDLLPGMSHFHHSQGRPGSSSSSPGGRSHPGQAGYGLRHLTPEASSSHRPILPLPQVLSWPHRQEADQTQGPLQGCPWLGQLMNSPEAGKLTLGTSYTTVVTAPSFSLLCREGS